MNRVSSGYGGQAARIAAVLVVGVICAVITTKGVDPYWNFVTGTIAATAIAAVGLNLLVGNSGLFSLATPAFMSIGGYGAGIILQHTPLGLIGAVILPIAAATLIGGLLGLLALRLRGFYLGLSSLGLLQATQYALIQGGSIVGSGYGFAMPTVSLGVPITVTAWSGIAVAALIVVCASAWSIRQSAVGRGLALMRQHEVVAGCAGMNVVRLKVVAFALSAGLGALSGVLFGFVQGAVSPDQFNLTVAVSLLAYIVLGGLGSVLGAVVGTAVLLLLPQFFHSLGQSQGILNAAVLLGVVIVAPQGMVPLIIRLAKRYLPPRLTRPRRVIATDEDTVAAARRTVSISERATAPAAATTAPAAIRFDDVEVRYGGVVAVRHFSADVQPGTVHGLIGPNGAGKSSAVGALFGLNRLTSGRIEVGGALLQRPERSSSPWVVATNGVGRTFQTPVAGRGLTALEAVQNGLFPNVHSGYVSALVRSGGVLRDEKATAELARHTLDLVRFTSDHYKPVAELTLGELRRVELARVLVGDPRVIVLDEPTSGLELMDADALFDLLRELAHVDNRSVLVVEHNVRLVFEYSDDVTVMSLGEVIAHGTSDEISTDTAVREAYLGAR
jgi:branched-chain amino acid transport system ATP-binding protein